MTIDSLLKAHAGVNDSVEDVNPDVDYDKERGEDQYDALHDREVSLQHPDNGQQPKTRVVKYKLHDDRAAKEVA